MSSRICLCAHAFNLTQSLETSYGSRNERWHGPMGCPRTSRGGPLPDLDGRLCDKVSADQMLPATTVGLFSGD
jgi:hypothetical protein